MKNNLTKALVFLSFLSMNYFSQAQPFIGFWSVDEVSVGDQTMTPVAKWTKIEKDGSYTSGNGWLQNAEGNWTYDTETSAYLPIANNWLKDPFGAFRVSFEGNEKMYWEREEDEGHVIVSLSRIEKIPESTANQIVGLWGLDSAEQTPATIPSDSGQDKQAYIFIRWDRIYAQGTPTGERLTGYWHVNGHRPEITLISHSIEQNIEKWKVSVNDTSLKLVGVSDSNMDIIRTYHRLDVFPK